MSRASLALFVGLLCVSTAGPFLVMARADALALVLYRMLFSAVLLLGWSAIWGELGGARPYLGRLLAGSLLLSAHFALWVKAFDLTDYSSNLLLLVTQPALAALLGGWLGERAGRDTWISLALAFVGLLIIAGGDVRLGPRALLGDLLCVIGAAAITVFVPVTKAPRAALPLATFLGTTFLFGSLWMAPLAWLSGDRFLAYPPSTWAWIAALVLLPTIAGHGLMNYAARTVRLYTLNLVIVLEPAIAIALGALLFGAKVTMVQLAGGAFLVAAVVVGLRQEPLRPGAGANAPPAATA